MNGRTLHLFCFILLVGVSVGKRSSRLMALLSESSNERGNNDYKHSSNAFSVPTNQIYQDDNGKEDVSFYQKLIGSKVDKYDEGSGIMKHLVDAKNMVADGIVMEANDIIQATTDSNGLSMIKSGMSAILETVL